MQQKGFSVVQTFVYSCMQSVDYFREYIYIFYQKDVTRILSVFRWDVSRSEIKYNLIPNTSLSWLFHQRILINFNETSIYRLCRQINAHDSLTCVNFRILLEYVTERKNQCYSTGMDCSRLELFQNFLGVKKYTIGLKQVLNSPGWY